MERICPECGAKLASDNSERLCSPCKEKERDALVSDDKLHYDAQELAVKMGLKSELQVRRRWKKGLIPGRVPVIRKHLYWKEIIDKWISSGRVVERRPTSPAQEKAQRQCSKKDHSWLTDDKLDGIAYETDTVLDRTSPSSMVLVERKCYFCGYTETGFI